VIVNFLAFLASSLGAAQPPAAVPAPAPAPPATEAPRTYAYRVVNSFPHDPGAFTEGLFYRGGELWESTGLVGHSTIRRVRLRDGVVLQSARFPPGKFGEGIVDWGSQIISLTWRGGVGYRWDRARLRRLGEFHYSGEGWALTRNDREIFMSDGTDQLRVLDPRTLDERRRIHVTVRGQPLNQLNELEWIDGEIFANVWMTAMIVRIDPRTGRVTGVIDLRQLAAENGGGEDNVLNGIAWDAAGRRLFVTGKNWRRLFEIALVPTQPAATP
jgi:glutaminyl-peptide cyclotransferase